MTLARLLKKFNAETLSVGFKDNSPETLALLCRWAETIFVAEERMLLIVPEEFRHKVSDAYTCGPDFWYYPGHPDLVTIYRQKLEARPPGPLGEPKIE